MQITVLEKTLWDFLVKDLVRLQKLEDYYTGKHKILEKQDRLKDKHEVCKAL